MAKSEYTDLTYFMIYGYKLVKNSEYLDMRKSTNTSRSLSPLWDNCVLSSKNQVK